ncbi:MAG: M48 family peptidase [Proteobacteria bacterium]|nr:M48 family peptidase [Pseudomonadota bacterium]
MGDSQMNSLGAQSFEEMKKKTPIEHDPKINAYVECIVKPVTEAARGRLDVQSWEVVVFQDPTANAFALPGGKIGVHTGILPVAKTPDQLAAVLGHEVGHVIARHGNERVSEGEAAAIVMGITDLVLNKMDKTKKSVLMASLGLGVQFGFLLPFSRTQESEADLIGLDLMAKAGFDPNQSVNLWENMIAASGGKAPPEWMSTHPASQNRISNLRAHIPEHLADYQAAKVQGRVPVCRMN